MYYNGHIDIIPNNKICHLELILYIKMVNCPSNKLNHLKRANINKSDRRKLFMNYKKTLLTQLVICGMIE